jgi:hypothetical protein
MESSFSGYFTSSPILHPKESSKLEVGDEKKNQQQRPTFSLTDPVTFSVWQLPWTWYLISVKKSFGTP